MKLQKRALKIICEKKSSQNEISVKRTSVHFLLPEEYLIEKVTLFFVSYSGTGNHWILYKHMFWGQMINTDNVFSEVNRLSLKPWRRLPLWLSTNKPKWADSLNGSRSNHRQLLMKSTEKQFCEYFLIIH